MVKEKKVKVKKKEWRKREKIYTIGNKPLPFKWKERKNNEMKTLTFHWNEREKSEVIERKNDNEKNGIKKFEGMNIEGKKYKSNEKKRKKKERGKKRGG